MCEYGLDSTGSLQGLTAASVKIIMKSPKDQNNYIK
jgi:hypothetical protein